MLQEKFTLVTCQYSIVNFFYWDLDLLPHLQQHSVMLYIGYALRHFLRRLYISMKACELVQEVTRRCLGPFGYRIWRNPVTVGRR
jgi:hypothetical protein